MSIPLTARMPVEYTPPALLSRNLAIVAENAELAKDGKEPKPFINIMVRVPTMYERDSFSSALVRGGVIHYSEKQIRDLMLAGVSYLYDEDRFDQIQNDLQEMWDAGDAAKRTHFERQDRYLEILEQQAERVKLNPRAKVMTEEEIEKELAQIQPDSVISQQQRVRTAAIQQDVTSRYEPLQKAFADLSEQETRRNWLCVEIYVVNWHGLEHSPDGNGRGGLTRAEAEWLRGAIGAEAFDQTAAFIFAMHSIDGDEEKNLASLIESSSAPIGSTMAGSMGETAPGNSTDEPSTETLDSASPVTTEPSPSSTKSSAKKTGRSRRSPTVAP